VETRDRAALGSSRARGTLGAIFESIRTLQFALALDFSTDFSKIVGSTTPANEGGAAGRDIAIPA